MFAPCWACACSYPSRASTRKVPCDGNRLGMRIVASLHGRAARNILGPFKIPRVTHNRAPLNVRQRRMEERSERTVGPNNPACLYLDSLQRERRRETSVPFVVVQCPRTVALPSSASSMFRGSSGFEKRNSPRVRVCPFRKVSGKSPSNASRNVCKAHESAPPTRSQSGSPVTLVGASNHGKQVDIGA